MSLSSIEMCVDDGVDDGVNHRGALQVHAAAGWPRGSTLPALPDLGLAALSDISTARLAASASCCTVSR
jgi:hypothetical protein